mmetsp:Transcript_22568/g.38668  ORF Transcript_22568/g.38668 Transcript_22568/m.38668 type:complete len:98 (-) Transcript_22568:124-417(-)
MKISQYLANSGCAFIDSTIPNPKLPSNTLPQYFVPKNDVHPKLHNDPLRSPLIMDVTGCIRCVSNAKIKIMMIILNPEEFSNSNRTNGTTGGGAYGK